MFPVMVEVWLLVVFPVMAKLDASEPEVIYWLTKMFRRSLLGGNEPRDSARSGPRTQLQQEVSRCRLPGRTLLQGREN